MRGEDFIPIFLFGGIAAVLIVYFSNRHKERMAIIEKGLNPQDYMAMYKRQIWTITPLTTLRWGLLAAFIGVGLIAVGVLDRLLGTWMWDGRPAVEVGLVFLIGGLGLVVFYIIAAKKIKDQGSQ